MTPEQEKLLDQMSKFIDTLTGALGKLEGDREIEKGPQKEKDKGPQEVNAATPKGAAQRVARTVLEAEGAKR